MFLSNRHLIMSKLPEWYDIFDGVRQIGRSNLVSIAVVLLDMLSKLAGSTSTALCTYCEQIARASQLSLCADKKFTALRLFLNK